MKQFIVAIFLCFAFSALVNAEQRKIAYQRGENIFVADADGTHSKKLRKAPGQKFRRTAHASRLTAKATRKIAPVLSVTLQSPTSPAAK
jgi:hypothetical protein